MMRFFFPDVATKSAKAPPSEPNLPSAVVQAPAGPAVDDAAVEAATGATGVLVANALTPRSLDYHDATGGEGRQLCLLSSREMHAQPDRRPSAIVVHLLAACNLPRLHELNRRTLSPYVVMCVVDHTGSMVGSGSGISATGRRRRGWCGRCWRGRVGGGHCAQCGRASRARVRRP